MTTPEKVSEHTDKLAEMLDSTCITEENESCEPPPSETSMLAMEQILQRYGIQPKKSRKHREAQLKELWDGMKELEQNQPKQQATGRKTKSKRRDSKEEAALMTELFKQNQEMYQEMLLYRPISLEAAREYLKSKQVVVSKAKLIKYFDQHGVFFKSTSGTES